MSPSQKPSVKKISEVTGYSPATVSNALNMKRGVNKETAERIFQVAEEMGYAIGAKGMKSIKFALFRKNGKIIDGSAFHPEVIQGVEELAKTQGLTTIFERLDRDAPDYDEQVSRLSLDISCGVILLATEMGQEDFEPFRHFRCPLVLLDGWCEAMDFNGVLINNVDSSALAVRYLIEKGHRRIGYLGGDFRIQAFQDRYRGFHRTMTDTGLSIDEHNLVYVGTKMDTAYEDTLRWLAEKPELPTAFFADNDLIALGAIKAFKESGIKVPDDVSVVGFDNLSYSAISTPALTTIEVDKMGMGREAVNRLLTMVERPDDGFIKTQCCTTFVERDSVRDIN